MKTVLTGAVRATLLAAVLFAGCSGTPPAPALNSGVDLANFYAAFGVKEGDKLYAPADQRVKIW